MKLNYKLIGVFVAGLLLGSPVRAEAGHMPMGKQAPAMHEQGSDNMQNKMKEQTGDAGANTGMHDKNMHEPMPMVRSGFSRGSVVRSIFTSAVKDREPVDSITKLDTRSDKVIYYTELRDMAGQTAKHRWEYNGKVMAEVKFKVGGARWRVWSSKKLDPRWTGEWKVSVLNGANEVISEAVLTYSPATAKPAAEKSAPRPVDSMQVQ